MANKWSRCCLTLCLFWVAGCAAAPQTPTNESSPEDVLVASDQKSKTMDPPPPDERNEEEEGSDPSLANTPREHAAFTTVFGYGAGTYDHNTRKSARDDDVAAAIFRGRTEFTARSGFGLGGAFEWMGTHDELLNNVGVVDGEAASIDIFPYAVIAFANSRARMPVRIGPYYHALRLEDDTPVETTWSSLGARLEVEPEIVLYEREKNAVSLFMELGGSLHVSNVERDSGAIEQDFTSDGYQLRSNAGLRGQWSGFTASISYLVRYYSVNQTDTETDKTNPTTRTSIDAIDTLFQGLYFEGGFRF